MARHDKTRSVGAGYLGGMSMCHDCSRETSPKYRGRSCREHYMVRDDLWTAAGMPRGRGSGHLCVGCLERRLGFTLVRGDFTSVSIKALGLIDPPRLRQRKQAYVRSPVWR